MWPGFGLISLRASIHHWQCPWMACGVNLVARTKAVSTINRLWNVCPPLGSKERKNKKGEEDWRRNNRWRVEEILVFLFCRCVRQRLLSHILIKLNILYISAVHYGSLSSAWKLLQWNHTCSCWRKACKCFIYRGPNLFYFLFPVTSTPSNWDTSSSLVKMTHAALHHSGQMLIWFILVA